MIGGRIQGANTPDFRDAVDLFTIGAEPGPGVLTRVVFARPGTFRYMRYLSPKNGGCNLSELAFLGPPKASP